MSNGRYCDNCETHLNDEDYVSYGSWSYTCHDCGFSYRHGSAGVGEQVVKFNSRPTRRAVDEGDSAPLQAESTPEHLPIEEADTAPALRN